VGAGRARGPPQPVGALRRQRRLHEGRALPKDAAVADQGARAGARGRRGRGRAGVVLDRREARRSTSSAWSPTSSSSAPSSCSSARSSVTAKPSWSFCAAGTSRRRSPPSRPRSALPGSRPTNTHGRYRHGRASPRTTSTAPTRPTAHASSCSYASSRPRASTASDRRRSRSTSTSPGAASTTATQSSPTPARATPPWSNAIYSNHGHRNETTPAGAAANASTRSAASAPDDRPATLELTAHLAPKPRNSRSFGSFTKNTSLLAELFRSEAECENARRINRRHATST
jgi:hypothetical protein